MIKDTVHLKILRGSHPEGHACDTSDVDLLVVNGSNKNNVVDKFVENNVEVVTRIYGISEFKCTLRSGDPFIVPLLWYPILQNDSIGLRLFNDRHKYLNDIYYNNAYTTALNLYNLGSFGNNKYKHYAWCLKMLWQSNYAKKHRSIKYRFPLEIKKILNDLRSTKTDSFEYAIKNMEKYI